MQGLGGEGGAGELTFGVLGPLRVDGPDGPRHTGGPKARAVLAMLILEHGRVVSAARLVEGVWGAGAPDGAPATLQVHVSNLRKLLGAGTVVTQPPGYQLAAADAAVDVAVFEADLLRARAARAVGDHTGAADGFRAALDRWRGEALADVRDAPFCDAAVPWLEERRTMALEERAEALLACGDPQLAIVELEAAVGALPHREKLWGLLMLALYRNGRQADALGAFQRARRVLGEQIGVPPGPELVRLETMILRHDPSLATSAAAASGVSADDGEALRETFEAGAGVRASLVLDDGSARPLEGTTVIGRHPDCGVRIADDGAVSRRHAEIRPSLGRHVLVDLTSTNGTSVNGAAVLQHLLVDGDVIHIGDHRLRYCVDGERLQAAPPGGGTPGIRTP